MKRIILNDDIFCMSNVRGSKVKVTNKLPFSFYFSGKQSSHDIRVKPIFNPDRMLISKAGTLKLCDDWNYIPGPDDINVSGQDIKKMKQFFKKYLVLFVLVWDNLLSDPIVEDYFVGDITLHELIQDLEFYIDYKSELDLIETVEELEKFCRSLNFVNFYGN